MEIPALASEENLDSFVQSFEDGTFPNQDFHHGEHLVIVACYLFGSEDDEATARMRTNIRRYNEAQGGQNTEDAGYHETLTIFWLRLVRANLPAGLDRLDAVRKVVRAFSAKRELFREYYSFDVVKSRVARRLWVCPDLPGPVGAFSSPIWERLRT